MFFFFLVNGATPALLAKLQEMAGKPLSSHKKEKFILAIHDKLNFTLHAKIRMMDLIEAILRVNP